MSAPSDGWRERADAVDRELHRRFGRTAQLRTSDEQGERIGQLLESGQLDCQALVLHSNRSADGGAGQRCGYSAAFGLTELSASSSSAGKVSGYLASK